MITETTISKVRTSVLEAIILKNISLCHLATSSDMNRNLLNGQGGRSIQDQFDVRLSPNSQKAYTLH